MRMDSAHLGGLFVSALVIVLSMPDTMCLAQGASRSVKHDPPVITPPPKVRQLPDVSKRYALLIGVDEYTDPLIPALCCAANDARELANVLQERAGFERANVRRLAKGQPPELQPTRANILAELDRAASKVPKDGLLLVAFSGHGMERGGQAYLLPSDARRTGSTAALEDTVSAII